MTNFCCEATARDGHGRDYKVLFVRNAVDGSDLVGPDGETVGHDMVIYNTVTALSAGFAEVLTTAEIINRL